MNASTAHSTRPAPTHTVTLLDTSSSDTIPDVGIQDSTTGPHTRSTTSTWNGGSQRELTVKELSGKRGAHQGPVDLALLAESVQHGHVQPSPQTGLGPLLEA